MQCVYFWLKVMGDEKNEGRILTKLVRHVVGCGKGAWVKNMAKCMGDFGWSRLRESML